MEQNEKKVDSNGSGPERDSQPSGEDQAPRDLDFILDIPLALSVELGRTRMLVNDLLHLGQGSIVELNKLAGEHYCISITHIEPERKTTMKKQDMSRRAFVGRVACAVAGVMAVAPLQALAAQGALLARPHRRYDQPLYRHTRIYRRCAVDR